MRIRSKVLAYALAFAMTITSLPTNVSVAKAAATTTPKSSLKQAENANQSAFFWNTDYFDEVNKQYEQNGSDYDYSVSGDTATFTETFYGNRKTMTPTLQVRPTSITYVLDEDGNAVEDEDGNTTSYQAGAMDEQLMMEVFGIASGSSISLPSANYAYSYQWYEVDEQGDEVLLEDQTSSYLYPEEDTLTNAQGKKTWICKITVDSIVEKYENEFGYEVSDYYYFEDYDDPDNPIDNTLTFKYVYQYGGPTAADFENGTYNVNDFIYGLSDTANDDANYDQWLQSRNVSGAAVWSSTNNYDRDYYLPAVLETVYDDGEIFPEHVTSNNIRYDYTWSAVSYDGDQVIKRQATNVSSVRNLPDPRTKDVFENEEEKNVSYFQVDVTYYYGYIELGTFSKRYNVVYRPIVVNPSEKAPAVYSVRNNGKVTFKVTQAEVYGTDVLYGYTYQWYKDEDGLQTKLDGEVTNVLKAKITDYDTTYICRLKAKVRSAYKDTISYYTDAVFTTTDETGYLVKEISDKVHTLQLGESVDLAIKAKVDSGYKLSYQWKKYSLEPATQFNPFTQEDEEGYTIKEEEVGTKDSLTVKPESEEDFKGVPTGHEVGEFFKNLYSPSYYNYKLFVTVKKAGATDEDEAYAVYSYSFKLNENVPGLISASNAKSVDYQVTDGMNTDMISYDGDDVVAMRGENTELYAESDELEGYKAEKKWYKYQETHDWTWITYTDPYEIAEPEETALPEDTAEPVTKDAIECVDEDFQESTEYHVVSYDEYDDTWSEVNIYRNDEGEEISVGDDQNLSYFEKLQLGIAGKAPICTYWIKSFTRDYYTPMDANKDGSVCTLKGRTKDGKFNDDVLGKYRMEANLYRDSDLDVPITTVALFYNVTYDSKLKVYAKNDTVEAALGASATLEVVASNINEKAYPITYRWAKWNEEGYYEDIEGENNSSLNLKKITNDDYGTYCVTIEDVVHALDKGELGLANEYNIMITLQPKARKYVVYTPDYSYYNASIGDVVNLTVDTELEDGTEPFYAWYRKEKVADNCDGYTGDDTNHWELINADTNEYKFAVKSDDDYTEYYCQMSFLTTQGNDTISVTKEFHFIVEDNYYFDFQKLTPNEQNKKLGSSATYSVKILTDNPNIKDEDITYQWYRIDPETDERVDIEGATGATYTIDSLTTEDFGYLYVEASANNNIDKYTQTTSFETYLINETSLDTETNNQTLYAKKGQSIELQKPIINNPEGFEWTYQWYYGSYATQDNIIYGATDASYTIYNIGENEFGTYTCLIYCDDALWNTFRCTVLEDTDTSHIYATVAEGYEADVEAVIGRSASFAVDAISNDNLKLTYQWYKYEYGWKAIGGANDKKFDIAVVTPASYGDYKCTVMDENNRISKVEFSLERTYELEAASDAYYYDDTIAYEVAIGGQLTLTADVSCAPEYSLYYQWYKLNEEDSTYEPIEDATQRTLSFVDIDYSDLGYYQCEAFVLDEDGEIAQEEFLYYQLYVDTGLVVVPGCKNVLVQPDGSVKMYVKAKANADETIRYEWSKYTLIEDEEAEATETPWNDEAAPTPRVDIEGSSSTETYTAPPTPTANVPEEMGVPDMATLLDEAGTTYNANLSGSFGYETIPEAQTDTFTLPQLTSMDYAVYRCVVSTSGESYAYTFVLRPYYRLTLDRGDMENVYGDYFYTGDVPGSYSGTFSASQFGMELSNTVYAEQGDTVNVATQILNPAVDVAYTYNWYEKQPSTGTMRLIGTEETTSSIQRVVPNMGWSDERNSGTSWKDYATKKMSYGCVISGTVGDQTEKLFDSIREGENAEVQVLPSVTYDNSKYPETVHPFDQVWNVTGFQLPDDGEYQIFFSEDTDVLVKVIDQNGTAHYPCYQDDKDKQESVIVSGKKAIFVTEDNSNPLCYGYKVSAIKKIKKADEQQQQMTGAATSGAVTASAVKALPKKGAKKTVSKLIYKITKSAKKNGTVSLVGVKASAKKSMKKVTVPATVKINGYTFKVTAVGDKALAGLTKLTTVTIGKNVKTIGKQAFSGDKKLKKITIKSSGLKSIGKKAFNKVPKKATVIVPKKQKKTYKKLLKAAGLKKAKIK